MDAEQAQQLIEAISSLRFTMIGMSLVISLGFGAIVAILWDR